MTDLSLTQIQEIRVAVSGAAAKVPCNLIGWKIVGIQVVSAVLYVAAVICTLGFPIPTVEAITLRPAVIFYVTGFLRLISAF